MTSTYMATYRKSYMRHIGRHMWPPGQEISVQSHYFPWIFPELARTLRNSAEKKCIEMNLFLFWTPPPPRTPNSQNYTFFTFWLIYEKLVVNCVPLLYMSHLWWGLHLLTFWYPWILCKGPMTPKKWDKKCFIFWIVSQKVFYQIAFIYIM